MAPVDHNQDVPALAVNVTLPPLQKVVGPPAEMVAVGFEFTVTAVTVEVAKHPAALVTVTVKFPVAVTLIDCVVAPVDHNQDAPALAVNVTFPPLQKVVGPPAEMVAVGLAFTVTVVAEDVLLHPSTSVTVTV